MSAMPKTGDRVRVVIEGVAFNAENGRFSVRQTNGWENFFAEGTVVSVEVLPPPEPEWNYGDVVRSSGGQVYERRPGGWHVTGLAGLLHDNVPLRPLTRLVPEGSA